MLGDNLRKLRTEKKLSMQDVAEIIGLKEDTYGTYERGTRKPPLDVLIKLADFYGASTDYLLGRDEKKFAEDISKMSDNDLDKKLMQFFIDLPESSKQGIRDFMMSVVHGLTVEPSQVEEPTSPQIVQTTEKPKQSPKYDVKMIASDGNTPETITVETVEKILNAPDVEDDEL